MSTSKAQRIGPIEHALLRHMDRARRHVWVFDVATLPPGLSADQARHAMSRLVDAGLVDRLERGTYVVQPRSGRVPVLPIDLVGAWLAREPYAVVGPAAAEYHRLSLDTPTTIDVQLARRKAPVDFRGVRFVFTKGRPMSVRSDNLTTPSGAVVASPAKTVVLLLTQEAARRGSRPRHDARLAIDMLDRGRRSRSWDRTDWAGLIARHGNAQAARRLGYLLERLDLPGADGLTSLRGDSGNKPFSPLYGVEGRVDTRWRLILNDPVVAALAG